MSMTIAFHLLALALLTSPEVVPTTASNRIGIVVKRALGSVALVLVYDRGGSLRSQGSGFFVSDDGTFVTNYHVIERASRVHVKLENGAFYEAAGLLASDPGRDLAILKIRGRGFAAIPLATREPELGEEVVAVGSPFGLEATVSTGIVSAIRSDDAGEKYIQTTAPLSSGSSGGALLSLDQEVVGVTTLQVREGQNLNFAIPASDVRDLLATATRVPLPFPSANRLSVGDKAPDKLVVELYGITKRSSYSRSSGRVIRVYVYDDFTLTTVDEVVTRIDIH